MKSFIYIYTYTPLIMIMKALSTPGANIPNYQIPEWGTLASNSASNTKRRRDSLLELEKQQWWQSSNFTSVDIAIIGAGHASLSAAISLVRNLPSNYKIRIYERDSELRTISQGMLSIWSNGNHYLSMIHPDLPKLLSEEGSILERSIGVEVDVNGVEKILNDSAGPPGVTLIRWHALRNILANVLDRVLLQRKEEDKCMEPKEDMLVCGHSLLTYKEVKDGVFLLFENGNIVKAKIAIGADGTFSAVRHVMHSEDRAIYFGQMNWNAIVPTDHLPDHARSQRKCVKFIKYDGDDGNKGSFPRWTSYVNDCGGGHTFFQLRVTDMEKAMALSGSKGRGGLGLKGVKDALLPVCQMSDHISNLLKSLPEEEIFERAIIGRLPLSTWLSDGGRVVLLGDAAQAMHPCIGQGANQAIGAAVALANAITSSHKEYLESQDGDSANDNLLWAVKGLKRYDENHRPRVEWVQRTSNLLGCIQSSGSVEGLSPEIRDLWVKWGFNVDDGIHPPEEGRDIIKQFDPLSISEVSLV